jgi:hypothetical protein
MKAGKEIEVMSKAMATLAAAAVWGLLIWKTNGESGIGWFILALVIIW